MKKSNILFIILIVCLFVTPAIIWAVCKNQSSSNIYVNFKNTVEIVRINNPDLTENDVEFAEKQVYSLNITNFFNYNTSCIYYQGNKKYLPEMREEGNVLYLGAPKEQTEGEKLKLHLNLATVKTVELNGKIIEEIHHVNPSR